MTAEPGRSRGANRGFSADSSVPGRGPVAAPVPVRPAATVMLLRDGDSGPEVFTLQRVSSMVFAGGMTVFPGGGVDPADRAAVPWSGPGPAWWASQWGIDEAQARTVVVTAVRELFEETGVLLAAPEASGAGVVGHTEGALERAPACASGEGPGAFSDADAVPAGRATGDGMLRDGLAAHRFGLDIALGARGLAIDAAALSPWARWITPPGPPRRYDTFFFAAALPADQHPDFATSEAVRGGWVRPGEALAAGRAGAIGLMPPTIAMLTDLAAVGSVADALAAPRDLAAVHHDRPPFRSGR